MAKIKNKASDVVAEKADVAAHEGPMTILEALKASGKTEPVAVGAIIERALLEVDSPKDQAKAFSQMVVEAFTAKVVSGVAGKACEPYFRCQAVTPHGIFHSAGMKFTREPTKVYRKNLTEHQIKTLEHENPHFLSVVPVQFE